MVKFPKNFLWGAATSAYQVEGNNVNSDWWPWEKATGKEPSGAACRHYELFEQDFDLAKNLHHSTHRLSVEWSRIEPEEGKFSEAELKHYLDVILALRARNIEPVVTLHHFTNPAWFSASGGWAERRAVTRFLRFCDVVVRVLAPHVRYWITINEPTIYISHSYMWGVWPPQAKSYWKAKAVHDHLVRAHIQAYRRVNDIYQELGLKKPLIGLSQHMQAIVACQPTFRNRLAVRVRDWFCNFEILNTLARHKAMDFVGVNYYSRQLVDVTSWWPGNLFMETCRSGHHPVPKNSLGWDIYPEGLCEVLLKLKRYHLPVIMTENGICTADDGQRWEFIASHLKNIRRAMDQGVNVTGYLYWALMDNFEWDKGFAPRFGLIDIDYHSCQRIVRESARKFGRICQTGVLEA